MEAPIYLDHAATTPVRPEVVEAMLPFLGGTFGNPSSAHRFGRAAPARPEQARAGAAAAHKVVQLGGEEVILSVDSRGLVDLDALDRALVERPGVVSVMWVNNELGVIQPVAAIAERCHAVQVPFH